MEEHPKRQESQSRSDWIYARAVWVPTLLWNLFLGRVLRRRRWWDVVDERVVLGALPFPFDVASLARMGVTGIVNTCEEYAGPQRAYRKHGIEQLRIPTVDFTPPSLKDVERAVEFIETHAKQEGRVYVHCKAGRGRSATVVMAWLMKTTNVDPSTAQRELTKARRHVNQHLAEREVVQQFYAGLLDASNEGP